MGLNKGRLIYDVTIQQLTESVGASKVTVKTWTTLLTRVWMSRETQTGAERFAAAQVSAQATTTWEMPYVASMDPDLLDVPKSRRLLYQGRAYDIQHAQHIGRYDRIVVTTLAHSKVAA